MHVTHAYLSSLCRFTREFLVVYFVLTVQTSGAQEQQKYRPPLNKVSSHSLAAAQAIPKEAAALESRLSGKLSPSRRAKIQEAAKAVSAKSGGFANPGAAQAAAESEVRKLFPELTNDSDIMALVFLITMQAARAANEDLKAMMAGVKKGNEEKKSASQKFALSRNLKKDVRRPAKLNTQSAAEMSEMQALRLQMAMDRRSKFISTLSNMMKKMYDTQSNIIQNMK